MKHTVLGCLPYLNVKPLIHSLEQNTPEGYELIYNTPSVLAGRLRDKSCDCAAVSSFEALSNPNLDIVPGISISSDGKVASVLLFSKTPFRRIRSVALDTSSLTGAGLTRILLAELFGVRPEFVRRDPHPVIMLQDCDACMVIGNNAMTEAPNVPFVMDLGEGWKKLTGLPFVFAVWAARRGAIDSRDIQILHQAKIDGMQVVETIAEEQARILGLPLPLVRNYLAEIMVYDLGQRELAGLTEFCRRAKQHDLIPQDSGLRLYQEQAARL